MNKIFMSFLLIYTTQLFGTDASQAIKTPSNHAIQQDAKVKKEWQEKFWERFVKLGSEVTEAWALFSYSGYSDRGQIMLHRGDKKSLLIIAAPNAKDVSEQRTFTSEAFKEFGEQMNGFNSLPDFDPAAFDGVQYEYVYLIKEKNVPVLKKRIFMNNPELSKGSEEYKKLLQLFRDLLTLKAKP